MRYTILPILLLAFMSCRNDSSNTATSQVDTASYLYMGDSIATQAQKILLENVLTAIQLRGEVGAVDFCNEKALPITQQTAAVYQTSITRLSDKNRNPANAITSETDMAAWEKLQGLMTEGGASKKHFIAQENDGVYYYKAIMLGAPTCLSCHGEKGKDIAAETWAQLQMKYPQDKAYNYRLGQLRGMWKIKLPATPEKQG